MRIRIDAHDEKLHDVGTDRSRRQSRIKQADQVSDVTGGTAPRAPSGEEATTTGHMHRIRGHAAVGNTGIVKQGEARSNRCEHGDRIVVEDHRVTVRGDRPGQGQPGPGEVRGPQRRETGMLDGTHPQRLAAYAIALDEVGRQAEQCRDRSHVVSHVRIVHRIATPMLWVIHRRLRWATCR